MGRNQGTGQRPPLQAGEGTVNIKRLVSRIEEFYHTPEMQLFILGAIQENIPGYALDIYADTVAQRDFLRGAYAIKLKLPLYQDVKEIEELLAEFAEKHREFDAEMRKEISKRKTNMTSKEWARMGGKKMTIMSWLAQVLARRAYAIERYKNPKLKIKKSDQDNQKRWAEIARLQFKQLFPEFSWAGDFRSVGRALAGWEPPEDPNKFTLDFLMSGLLKSK